MFSQVVKQLRLARTVGTAASSSVFQILASATYISQIITILDFLGNSDSTFLQTFIPQTLKVVHETIVGQELVNQFVK